MVAPLWPVYCCTKGRAGRVAADVRALNPILVLEGAERPRYQKAYPELRQRPLSAANRGVSYARNGLMVAARNDGAEWCWMLDDDLYEFQRRRLDKEPEYLEPAEALGYAQAAILRVRGVGLAGLPVAWARVGQEADEMRSEERLRLNVNCYCCVALHLPSLVGLTYREELKLREDTDFSLQVLFRGLKTVRVDGLAYQMPICGTGTGGLAATYAQSEAKAAANRRLGEIWPGIVHTGGDCRSYWCDWQQAGAERRRRASVVGRAAERSDPPAPAETAPAPGRPRWVPRAMTG